MDTERGRARESGKVRSNKKNARTRDSLSARGVPFYVFADVSRATDRLHPVRTHVHAPSPEGDGAFCEGTFPNDRKEGPVLLAKSTRACITYDANPLASRPINQTPLLARQSPRGSEGGDPVDEPRSWPLSVLRNGDKPRKRAREHFFVPSRFPDVSRGNRTDGDPSPLGK